MADGVTIEVSRDGPGAVTVPLKWPRREASMRPHGQRRFKRSTQTTAIVSLPVGKLLDSSD
jgi:hypothetical protein